MKRARIFMRFDKRIGVPEQQLLIPTTNTVAVIMQRIRERFLADCKHITKHTAVFLFFSTDNTQRMFPVTTTLHDIIQEMGGPDILVIDVAIENTFGKAG